MKKLTTVLLVTAAIAANVSCKKDLIGSGPVTTEARSVTNFNAISLRMNGHVFYRNDSAWKVEVSAKQSIHPVLQTNVVNGVLIIKYNDGRTYDADESIRISVSGPGVSSFATTTSGSVFCENNIQVPNLYLRSTGSGSISLKNITANIIDAASTVSGSITATGGTAYNEILETDASGKIEISGIAAKYAKAHTIGSGDIRVKVSEHLEATIDGSGSVYFSGYPSLTTHIAGTGRLIRF